MATDTLSASLPFVTLNPGMTVRFEAISPTTGAAVSGVTITDVAIYAQDENPQPDTEDLPPTWVPLPESAQAIHPGAN